MVNAFLGGALGGAGVSIVIKGVDQFSNTFERATSKLGILGKIGGTAIKGLATLGVGAAAGLTAAGGAAIKTAGEFESARQGFVALLGSAEEASAVMERIKKEAAATPFELEGLTKGTQALTAITKDGDRAIDILLDVGKAVAVSGKGQEELNRVVLNLQQIAATKKVTALDIKQFQSAIPVFNDILQASDLTIEKLQSSADASELLFDAFKKAADQGGIASKGFEVQAGTFNQLVSNLKDNFTILGTEIVTTSGLFDLVKGGLSGVVDFLTNNKDVIVSFFEDVISFGLEFGEKLSEMSTQAEPFIKALIDGFKPVVDFFVSRKDEIINVFSLVGKNILRVVEFAGALWNMFKLIFKLLVDAGVIDIIIAQFKSFQSILAKVLDVATKVVNIITDLIERIAESGFGKFIGGLIKKLTGTVTKGLEAQADFWMPQPMSTQGAAGMTINIENVQGADPQDMSDALKVSLNDLIGTP